MTIIYDGRIGWKDLFMAHTRLWRMRSACENYRVGVVFAHEKSFLTSGYNGPGSGEPHCIEVGCAKRDEHGNRLPAGSGMCRGLHAEINALINADKEGINLEGASVYCTYSPCYDCAKHLSRLCIREFYYEKEYEEEEGKRAIDYLENRKIKVKKHVLNPVALKMIVKEMMDGLREEEINKILEEVNVG